MARGTSTNFIDYGGGVNPESGEYLLSENEAKDARNLHGTPLGSLKKRNGFVQHNDSTLTSVTDLDTTHSIFPVNTSTKSLIVVGNDSDAGTDTIAKVTTGGVCSVLDAGNTANTRWEWVQAPTSGGQGPIYGVNGVDPPLQWDGSAGTATAWTVTVGTIPTTAKYLLYHADRIWATGTSNKGRVQYSGLTTDTIPAPDPRTWASDGYVDIEPQDGDEITGLQDVGPYILVTKARRSYVITDPSTGAWRQISNTVGCIAHRSMVSTPRGTIFLSDEAGVCITDGTEINTIGDNILPFIRQAAADNPIQLNLAAGCLWENSYYLSIPYASSENDILLEYDLLAEAWWPHSIGSNQFAVLDPVGTPKLYSALGTDPRVDRAFVPETFTDDGVAYTDGSYYIGPYLPFGEPHLNKQITQFRMDGRGTWGLSSATSFSDDYENLDGVPLEETGDLEGETFGGSGVTFGGSGSTFGPDAAGVTTQWAYYTPGFGRAWSLKIENDDGNDMEIFSTAAFILSRTD